MRRSPSTPARQAQPVHAEAQVQRHVARGQAGLRCGGGRREAVQPRGQRGRTVECQQQQRAVSARLVGLDDAALHIGRVEGRRHVGQRHRLARQRRRRELGRVGLAVLIGVQPMQRLFETRLGALPPGLQEHRPIRQQAHEIGQQFHGGPVQHAAVGSARRIDIGQPEQPGQRAQTLAEDLGPGFDQAVQRPAQIAVHRVGGAAEPLPGDLFGDRRGDPRQLQFGAGARAVQPFVQPQVALVVDGDAGHGVEELGLVLPPAQPFAPVLEAVFPAVDVAHGVAEDQVQQPRHLLPDGAHVGLARPVVGDGQQHQVLRRRRLLDQFDAHRMDAADALHRVGQQARQVELVGGAAPCMQRAQHALDAGLVGHRVQRRHEAGQHRRDHAQVDSTGEAAILVRRVVSHALLLVSGPRRPAVRSAAAVACSS
jgi:hypothetical protein